MQLKGGHSEKIQLCQHAQIQAGIDSNGQPRLLLGYSVADADDTTAAASGAAATLTYAATSGYSHVIGDVMFSYATAPTAGLLTVQYQDADDSNIVPVLKLDVTSEGAGPVVFSTPKIFPRGKKVVITLAAGGAAKNLNVATHALIQ